MVLLCLLGSVLERPYGVSVANLALQNFFSGDDHPNKGVELSRKHVVRGAVVI